MGAQVGDRVIALRSADDTTVYVYGRGVYLGPQEMPYWDPDSPGRDGITWRAAIEEQVRYQMDEPQKEWVCDGRPMGVDNYGNPMGDTRTFEERVAARLADVAANPCIQLDNGAKVYGYFCWWGTEDQYTTAFRRGRGEQHVPVPDPLPPHPAL